jgi:hypothetical protein
VTFEDSESEEAGLVGRWLGGPTGTEGCDFYVHSLLLTHAPYMLGALIQSLSTLVHFRAV